MALLIERWRTIYLRTRSDRTRVTVTRQGRTHIQAGMSLLLLATLLVTLGTDRSSADADSDREYAVKAAYIYNFAKFVEWPADAFARPDSPFVIGIIGKDPFGSVIDKAVQGKTIDGRSFTVVRLKLDQDLKQCQILFVSASEKDKISRLFSDLKGAPVLTVGETPQFASRGGIINFKIENGTVRFEINPDAAKRAHLTISSKLLSLARIVKDEKR